MSVPSAREGDSLNWTRPDSRLGHVIVGPARSSEETGQGVSMREPASLQTSQSVSAANNSKVPSRSSTGTYLLTESVTALEKLAEAIAARLPCNPNSPKNQKHQRAFQRQMQRHFRQIEAAFPYQAVSDIYERYVRDET